jgi:hypothetical protein
MNIDQKATLHSAGGGASEYSDKGNAQGMKVTCMVRHLEQKIV